MSLTDANSKRAEGYIGAFSNFACVASDIVEAIETLRREFAESNFALVGIEMMLPTLMLDRQLSVCEQELIEATQRYPVQFKDVHLYKADA